MSKSVEELFVGAPSNTTHYDPALAYPFIRKSGCDVWEFWSDDTGLWYAFASYSPNSKVIKRPQPKPWSGPEDGLPPVGLPCEAELYHGGGWIEGFVAYYGKAHFIFESTQLTVGVEISGKIRTSAFRPIRTPEQIAAESRESAIRELMDIAQVDCRVTAARLVDAGFKREGV